MVDSHNCPKCGAPLPPRAAPGLLVCLYCNSTLRFQPESTQAQVAIEAQLSADAMAQVKQFLLASRPQDALVAYQQKTGATLEDAQAAIRSLEKQIALNTLRHQLLSPYGVALYSVSIILFVASIGAGILGVLHPLLAVVLAGFSALQMVILWSGLRLSLQFLGARTARAKVLRLVQIGAVEIQKQPAQAVRLLVDVEPSGEPNFQAEIQLLVREKNLSKAQPGAVVEVKYLPRDHQRVLFHKPVTPG